MLRKLGRRGGGKRSLPPPPRPFHRPPSADARLPVGSSTATRNRPATDATAESPPDMVESFRLMRGEPDFGAIIRLTPDIVEEIRRVEAEGGSARVKFDSNSNNISGNVIDVGGKEFRFTWSRELGDLCDIYEERQSGEDGNGLLIESGSAWRKLNVQRILDESAKNHVKMRSEEAERLQKSRKAIVLDRAIPSVKNQVKSIAAAGIEGSIRSMNWKQKKELQSQKQKLESNQGLPKPALKLGTSSSITSKSRMSISPQMTPSEQQGPDIIVSTFGAGNFSNPEETSASMNLNKENIGSFEKEMPVSVVQGATHEATGRNWVIRDEPMDLRSILITLLSEKPNGMVPKALEKAAGEAIPNSRKKINSVLKNIATFQAPGRYFLKPGVEIECSKRHVSERGSYSSLESARERTSAAKLVFMEKDIGGKFKQQSQLSSNLEGNLDSFEKIEANQNDQDLNTSDRKVINDNDGRPCSFSESESESDSSDSGSQSKSRSPAVSRSSSSSDSESDGSPSSEEGSDMEVEIMSGDDAKAEAKHENEAIELKVPSLPKTASADEHEVIGITINDHEGQIMSQPSDFNCFKMRGVMKNVIEVSEESPTSNSVKRYENLNNEISKTVEMNPYQMKFSFSDEGMSSDSTPVNCKQTGNEQISNDRNIELLNKSRSAKQTMSKGKSVHQQSDVSERSTKLKLKRVSDSEDFQDKSKSAKRPKSVSSDQGISSVKSRDKTISENSLYGHPDTPRQEIYREHVVRVVNKADGNTDNDMQKSLAKHGSSVSKDPRRMQQSPDFWSSSSVDAEQPGPRACDSIGRRKTVDNMEKFTRYAENLGHMTNKRGLAAIKATPIHDILSLMKDETHERLLDKTGGPTEKCPGKESSTTGKISTLESSSRSVVSCGKLKDTQQTSSIHKTGGDKSSVLNRKGIVVRRELPDLESGKQHEHLGEDSVGLQGPLEQNSYFKSIESEDTAPDNVNLNTSKGRTTSSVLLEGEKQSPTNLRTGTHHNQNGFTRRGPVDDFMESTQTHRRELPFQSQQQQLLSVNHSDNEAFSLLDNSAEITHTVETRMGLGNCAGAHQKIPASVIPQHDNKNGGRGAPELQKSSRIRGSTDQHNNVINHSNGRRECFSDEDNYIYSKFDKDKPELRGPVKNFSQFEEYVKEYREKYDHYCALNRNLQNTSNNFVKVGKDLEVAKGRNMGEYYTLVEQLNRMYRECGKAHKKKKKVFILLHNELQNLKQRLSDFAQTYKRE